MGGERGRRIMFLVGYLEFLFFSFVFEEPRGRTDNDKIKPTS